MELSGDLQMWHPTRRCREDSGQSHCRRRRTHSSRHWERYLGDRLLLDWSKKRTNNAQCWHVVAHRDAVVMVMAPLLATNVNWAWACIAMPAVRMMVPSNAQVPFISFSFVDRSYR